MMSIEDKVCPVTDIVVVHKLICLILFAFVITLVHESGRLN